MTSSFYGEPEGLRWLEDDLRALGLSPVRYEYGDRDAVEVAVHSEGFAALLRGLGMPEGRKTGRVHVPGLVRRGPDRVALEFLSGLFGADGWISARENRVEVGIAQASPWGESSEFLEGVSSLLKRTTGVYARVLEAGSYETSVDGRRSVFGLGFRGEHVERFLTRVPFEYSVRKRELGLWAGAYLRYRARGGKDAFERFVEERCLPGGLVLDRVVDVERR
ncbi:orphan DOD family homing endonuclease [Methanopyrus kandleri AV19]|uniref:Orphan DOD family homing endonuclease n=1 Tax=Methanopyrus kandleri (strain AV19 / DSM 6324 / JCM 9639 / NBRC 100938) TaxID=190192 RepID=Q8TUW6_METKA|nr:orphan DOD family homing endonuclease [Methanopyrus kandleri AV19]